jgi:hypothetical protein
MGILSDELSELLARALRGLRFGSLEIVVHEGQIVHVERRERLRLTGAEDRSPDSRMRKHNPADRAHRTTGGPESMNEETTA